MNKKLWLLAAVFAVFTLLFAACPTGNNTPPPGPPGPPEPGPDGIVTLTGFTIVEGNFSIERDGGTKQLTHVFTPSTADDQSVTYKTSSASNATVSSTGLVTGVNQGMATITATPGGDPALAKTITVTVTKKSTDIDPETMTIKKGGVEVSTLTMNIGESVEFDIDWGSTTPTDTSVLWTPVDTGDARVIAMTVAFPYFEEEYGALSIKAIGPGTKTYRVRSNAKTSLYKDIAVTVSNKTGFANPVTVDEDGFTWWWNPVPMFRFPVKKIVQKERPTIGWYPSNQWFFSSTPETMNDKFAQAAAKTGSVMVFYISRTKFPTGTQRVLQIGDGYSEDTDRWVGQPIDLLPGQTVYRLEVPVAKVLKWEMYAYKNEVKTTYYDNYNQLFEKYNGTHPTTPPKPYEYGTDENGLENKFDPGAPKDPSDPNISSYRNDVNYYTYYEGSYNYFQHYWLGRSQVSMFQRYAEDQGGTMLKRIELEIPN
jgi:hypothetical protein